MRIPLLCLTLLVVFASGDSTYRLVGVSSDEAAFTTTVTAVDFRLDTTNVSVRIASNFSAVRDSSPSDYASYVAYGTRAAAYDSRSGTLYTLSLAPTKDGWRVCRWPTLQANNRSLAPPICSRNLAPITAGVPSAVVYLGTTTDLLLVAYPQAGDIYALVGRTLAPWANKWATGLLTPCSMAIDPVNENVYIALLNDNAVIRKDYSGSDIDHIPWLVIPRPRFVRANLAAAAADPVNQPAFYVMTLDADLPELHRIDRNGSSMGSVVDIAGDWLLDDTTGAGVLASTAIDPLAELQTQQIVSIAVDPRGVLYVARTGSERIETYSTLSGDQLVQADDSASLSDTLVKGSPVLITDSAQCAPLALLDAYALRVQGIERAVLMGCVASFASGGVNEPPAGIWACDANRTVLLYDSENIYTLNVDVQRGTSCFGEFLYHEDVHTISDVYLDQERNVVYALLSSGEVLSVDGACTAGVRHTVHNNISSPFNVAALAGLAHDFFVAPSIGPALVATSEMLLANGSWYQTKLACQPTSTSGASRVVTLYSATYNGVLLAFSDAQTLSVQLLSLNGTTSSACATQPVPVAGDDYAFVQDADSGVFGWLDISSGVLYTQNDANNFFTEAGCAPLFAPGALLAFADPEALSIRYPQQPTTTTPPSSSNVTTRAPKPSSGGSRGGIIVAWISIVLLMLCCAVALTPLCRRSRPHKPHDEENNKHAMPGSGSTTYETALDHNGDAHGHTYLCSDKTRYYLRLVLCPLGFCYGSDDRLRFGASILGGKRKARPYARMQDDSIAGRELPQLLVVDDSSEGGRRRSTEGEARPPASDVAAGGSAFVEVQLDGEAAPASQSAVVAAAPPPTSPLGDSSNRDNSST